MEKRVSQASLKICKKSEKKQFNSLLKALRPKVYITDSSSFKKLVQELTGNGGTVTSPPPSEQVPLIEIDDHEEQESSKVELSVDSPELGNQTLSPLATFTAFQTSWVNQQLQYQELESWLSEIDPIPFYDGYAFQNEQAISVSDYDYFSELYNIL